MEKIPDHREKLPEDLEALKNDVLTKISELTEKFEIRTRFEENPGMKEEMMHRVYDKLEQIVQEEIDKF